jgi:hypothetical protein
MTQDVGYKRPPDHSKWKKGQSGNPTGRKKGSRNLGTDLAEEMAQIIHLTEGGKPRRLTKQQALLKGLTARAIKGDARAATLVLNLMMRLLGNAEPENTVDVSAEDEALVAAFLARQGQKGELS